MASARTVTPARLVNTAAEAELAADVEAPETLTVTAALV